MNTYELNSLEEINKIKIPSYKRLKNITSPVNNIEYILQRKATEYKKNGQMDLAIACLRKSNEIMPHSNYSWSAKDYLRLIEFLKNNGQFAEARLEEEKLRKSFPSVFDPLTIQLKQFSIVLKNARSMRTDLLEMTEHSTTCSECSKYQGRVYSISGNDNRFPKLPDIVSQIGAIHMGCRHTFYPFIYGVSSLSNGKDPINYSNRPFTDNRTAREIAQWEQEQREIATEALDRSEFDFIREHLPDAAPKSLAGYRKMKNANTKSYISLMDKIRKAGYDLNVLSPTC